MSNADQTPDPPTIRLVIRDEVSRLIAYHAQNCTYSTDAHPKRLRELEQRFSTLLGFMAGSGLLGGVSGALISKLWP